LAIPSHPVPFLNFLLFLLLQFHSVQFYCTLLSHPELASHCPPTPTPTRTPTHTPTPRKHQSEKHSRQSQPSRIDYLEFEGACLSLFFRSCSG
jgi:hypothetical protein